MLEFIVLGKELGIYSFVLFLWKLPRLLGRTAELQAQNLLGAGDAVMLLMKKYLVNGMHMNEQKLGLLPFFTIHVANPMKSNIPNRTRNEWYKQSQIAC